MKRLDGWYEKTTHASSRPLHAHTHTHKYIYTHLGITYIRTLGNPYLTGTFLGHNDAPGGYLSSVEAATAITRETLELYAAFGVETVSPKSFLHTLSIIGDIRVWVGSSKSCLLSS